jgi:transglutaminase-like putative cysteine protease
VGTDDRIYRVRHETSYHYGARVTDGYTVTCLVPRPTEAQEVDAAEVRMVPDASEWDSFLDAFGNLVHQFGLHEPHDSMTVVATSQVRLTRRERPVDQTPWEDVREAIAAARGERAIELAPFRASSKFVDVDALREPLFGLASEVFTPGRPIVEAAAALCGAIHQGFAFDPNFSNVSTPLVDVLSARRGVCQDFAHLAVGCLRTLGLAARYVSGYIETAPPPGQERLVGADASHAWCSVWTPEADWVDFDPTNGHLPVDDHITVGWGRDYADVMPVRGVMIGPSAEQELRVSVDVERV